MGFGWGEVGLHVADGFRHDDHVGQSGAEFGAEEGGDFVSHDEEFIFPAGRDGDGRVAALHFEQVGGVLENTESAAGTVVVIEDGGGHERGFGAIGATHRSAALEGVEEGVAILVDLVADVKELEEGGFRSVEFACQEFLGGVKGHEA